MNQTEALDLLYGTTRQLGTNADMHDQFRAARDLLALGIEELARAKAEVAKNSIPAPETTPPPSPAAEDGPLICVECGYHFTWAEHEAGWWLCPRCVRTRLKKDTPSAADSPPAGVATQADPGDGKHEGATEAQGNTARRRRGTRRAE